jgi:hypothetical protein
MSKGTLGMKESSCKIVLGGHHLDTACVCMIPMPI